MRRWQNFIAIGLAFLAICAVSVAVVSAAQTSLPGDRIYPVKLVLERLRLALASDDVSRARIHLECLETRLNELDQTLGSDGMSIALRELDRSLTDATRAVAALPDAAQGDMRAQLARLALRAADTLARWRAAHGGDPLLDRVLAKARALAEVAADPQATMADLLRALDRFPAAEAEQAPRVVIDEQGIPVPPELIASHRPPFTGQHALISCNTCHVDGQTQGMSAACIACHEDPHEGKFDALGHDCTACHTDVVFKPSTFDHVRFPNCQSCHEVETPPGHYPGQCSNCHATTAWKPADFNHAGFTDCVACHSRAAPPGHFPGQCGNCHNTNAWKPATFSHAGFTDCIGCHSAKAPADHFPGQCSSCHNTSAWIPATFNHAGFTDCIACHAAKAPPRHFPGQCGSCHNTNAWKPATFNHAGFTDCVACHAARAPAGHFAGQCSNCHNTSRWKPASFNHAGFTDCVACHAARAPSGHFAGQCSNCHNTSGWKPATFDHAGLSDCIACHAARAPAGHFPGQCSNCHNTSSWKGATFSHGFPMDHKGAGGNCSTCHPGGNTGSWTCANCHDPGKMDEKHKEIAGYSGNCIACHADGRKPKEGGVWPPIFRLLLSGS